jgi:hypothetical protein
LNKKIIYLFFAIFYLLYSEFSFAQEIRVDTIKVAKTRIIKIVRLWTVPKFILQFSGNYNSGAMELSQHNGGFSRSDFELGKSYCARNGFGFSLIGKLPLNKKGRFWLDIISSFNRFQSNLIATNTDQGKVSYNVFSGGIGLDYNFTATHRVKYFLGANTLLSSISGKASLIDPNSSVTKEIKINSSFRMGYSMFVGFEYAFEKNIGFNLGVKFTHANLLLKSSSVLTDSTQTGLNDDGKMQIYSGWKQFAYASAFGGFSYYFGVRERRYKLP